MIIYLLMEQMLGMVEKEMEYRVELFNKYVSLFIFCIQLENLLSNI